MYIWWLYDLHLYTVVGMVSYCIYHEHYILSSILLWSGISEVASRKFDIYDLLSVKYLYSHKCDSLRIFIMYFYTSVTCAHFNHVVLLLYIWIIVEAFSQLQANSAKGEPIKGDWNGGVYGAVVLQNARQRGYVLYRGGCVLCRGGRWSVPPRLSADIRAV